MRFIYETYLPLYIIGTLSILGVFYFLERANDSFVKKYWFYHVSKKNWISRFFYALFVGVLLLGVLDLRGPAQKIDASIPDQKTIILFDMSSSMLTEDVRPSRIKRATFLARHFVKKAVGHQISVVLFSDTTKQYVPFTDDVDLLESKIAALDEIDISYAGSNISLAIQESLQLIKVESNRNSSDTGGNILLFTDGEEVEGGVSVNVPPSVRVSFVGLGTAKGGQIPLRGKNGSFKQYKKYGNEEITSKLNESFFKSTCEKIGLCKYWIATSYSIPTEEVLTFFNSQFRKSIEKASATVSPVYGHYVIVVAIIFYVIFFLFSRGRSYRPVLLLAFLFFNPFGESYGQDSVNTELEAMGEKEKKVNPELNKYLEKLKDGGISKEEKLKIGEELLREKDYKKANQIYEETLRGKKTSDLEVQANYFNSLLGTGNYKKAAEVYDDIKNAPDVSEEMKDKLRKNMVSFFAQKPQQDKKEKEKKDEDKKKEQDEKKNKDQQEDTKNQDDNKDDSKGDGKDQKERNDQDGENQKEQKDRESDKKNQKENDKEKEKKNNSNDEKMKDDSDKKEEQEKKEKKEEQMSSRPENWEDKVSDIEKKRRMKKIPGMIKQILNDDRELQKNQAETSLGSKRDRNQMKKDW